MQESILFILLIIFLIIIAYFRLKIQLNIGPMYDSYDFLSNAALFAGKNIGYSALRPPFLSFITSIIFRFEGLSINPIFYVDAIIDVLGVIGLYFFLKLRFNALNSFHRELIIHYFSHYINVCRCWSCQIFLVFPLLSGHYISHF